MRKAIRLPAIIFAAICASIAGATSFFVLLLIGNIPAPLSPGRLYDFLMFALIEHTVQIPFYAVVICLITLFLLVPLDVALVRLKKDHRLTVGLGGSIVGTILGVTQYVSDPEGSIGVVVSSMLSGFVTGYIFYTVTRRTSKALNNRFAAAQLSD